MYLKFMTEHKPVHVPHIQRPLHSKQVFFTHQKYLFFTHQKKLSFYFLETD
jgi:hypothetical protein